MIPDATALRSAPRCILAAVAIGMAALALCFVAMSSSELAATDTFDSHDGQVALQLSAASDAQVWWEKGLWERAGFNTVNSKMQGMDCMEEGNPLHEERVSGHNYHYVIKEMKSQKDIDKAIDTHFSASYGGGGFSASASFDFARSTKFSEFTHTWLVDLSIEVGETSLRKPRIAQKFLPKAPKDEFPNCEEQFKKEAVRKLCVENPTTPSEKTVSLTSCAKTCADFLRRGGHLAHDIFGRRLLARTPPAKNTREGFYKRCGNMFIGGARQGGRLQALFTFESTKKYDKTSIDQSSSASGWGFSMKQKFKSIKEAVVSGSKMMIKVRQSGGQKFYAPNDLDELLKHTKDFSDNVKRNPVKFEALLREWRRAEGYYQLIGVDEGSKEFMQAVDTLNAKDAKLTQLDQSIKDARSGDVIRELPPVNVEHRAGFKECLDGSHKLVTTAKKKCKQILRNLLRNEMSSDARKAFVVAVSNFEREDKGADKAQKCLSTLWECKCQPGVKNYNEGCWNQCAGQPLYAADKFDPVRKCPTDRPPSLAKYGLRQYWKGKPFGQPGVIAIADPNSRRRGRVPGFEKDGPNSDCKGCSYCGRGICCRKGWSHVGACVGVGTDPKGHRCSSMPCQECTSRANNLPKRERTQQVCDGKTEYCAKQGPSAQAFLRRL